MNAVLRAARLGFLRSLIEFKQFLRNPQEIIWTVSMSLIFLIVLWFQRNSDINGVSLALLTLPGLLGMTIAQGGFSGTAGTLSYDREDGTLLRAKAIPQGMVGYLVSRVLYIIYSTLISLVILFIPSLFLINGLTDVGWLGLVTFAWLFILGFLATAPWGAIIGSVVKSSGSGWGLTFLPLAGMVAISGIFYPISALAGWLQALAQVFPVYWLGLGARSIFLPDSAALNEIGGSWRTDQTVLILSLWAIVGFLIAPRVLRHMARRESGSSMEDRKQKVLNRGY
ncbi:MAG TPA: ABC transporter permease [Candidatus Saccharimonadales bacterium]|nr:ABC transporter permease [Candidatus Saccharimonadales bacterium]